MVNTGREQFNMAGHEGALQLITWFNISNGQKKKRLPEKNCGIIATKKE